MSFFIEKARGVKDKVLAHKDRVVIMALSASVSEALEAPEETRDNKLKVNITMIEKAFPKISPSHHPSLYVDLGRCYQGLGENIEGIRMFERAIEDHLSPSDNRSFRGYVGWYLTSLNTIPQLEKKEVQKEEHERAVEKIKELIPVVPSMEYKLRGFLGREEQQIGRTNAAFHNMEASVLKFPNPDDPTSDFSIFLSNYLNTAIIIIERSHPHIRRGGREAAVRDLKAVLNSVTTVRQNVGNRDRVLSVQGSAIAHLRAAGVHVPNITQQLN